MLRRSNVGYVWGGHESKINHCVKMEGIVLPDGQVMKEIDNSGYKYLGILETDQLREKETKDLFSKEYKRHRPKLMLKTKLSGKNKIMAVDQHMGSCNSKV